MKALGWIVGLVVLLIVGVGIYLVMNSGALLERAIERYGTAYLGAPVEVGGANVSVTDGSAGVDELVIENPEPFSGPPAFRLGHIRVAVADVSTELAVLESVTIDGAALNLLAQGRNTNLQALMDHLNEQLGPADETDTPSELKLIIDRFSFTNATAAVDSDVLGQAQVTLPDIELSDIGRQSNGVTIGEALKQVLEPVVRAATRRLAEEGLDLEGARERLEETLRDQGGDRLNRGLEGLRDRLSSQPDEE